LKPRGGVSGNGFHRIESSLDIRGWGDGMEPFGGMEFSLGARRRGAEGGSGFTMGLDISPSANFRPEKRQPRSPSIGDSPKKTLDLRNEYK
jgi:hypothetical protein